MERLDARGWWVWFVSKEEEYWIPIPDVKPPNCWKALEMKLVILLGSLKEE